MKKMSRVNECMRDGGRKLREEKNKEQKKIDYIIHRNKRYGWN
jgi:hypothetical protein